MTVCILKSSERCLSGCAVATVFVTFAEKIFIKGPFPAKVKMFSNIQDNTLYDEK